MEKTFVFPEDIYPVKTGDRVKHIRTGRVGVVLEIDRNFRHPTTCDVELDDGTQTHFWTDTLVKLP